MLNLLTNTLKVAGVFFLICAAGIDARAETFARGFVGCASEEALREITRAVIQQDERQFSTLMGTFCIPIRGLEYSTIRKRFPISSVRVYLQDGKSIVLWVPAEAVR